jgi:hypothetical protein
MSSIAGDLKRSPFLFLRKIQKHQDIAGGEVPLNSFIYFVCAGQPAGIPFWRPAFYL